ncbi:MAG TPA: HEAT repeat domain-containing protein [Opitutaceae bacterium]|nr:HEAT repeat domain-containing protein [Opitutaceae bacterium]
MNCERIQESFLDYQDGRLSPADAAAVRDHLKTCLDCQREWAGLQEISLKLDRLPPVAPSPRLRTQFYAMLETHRRAADSRSPFVLVRSRLDRFFTRLLPARPALQFALACSLLVAGLLVGARYLRPAAPATDPAVARELADLRTKIETMDKLVSASLQRQPAGERLRTVLASSALKDSGPVIVNGLLTTLAFDPSVNVRLSALEALYPHADQSAVRSAVASALPREPSPLVQVAMIDFLATTRDPAAISTLESVSRTATYDQTVRTAARHALAQL